jgi:hypothetical protein
MRKGISPIISFVLLVLVSISAIYLVLNVAKPTVDRAYESAAMNEAEQNMQLLDNLIREVASEGTGSFRTVVLKVSDGDYRVVNTSGNFTGAVQYKIDLKYIPFAAPMLKKVGNLKYTAGTNSIGLVGYWNLDDRNGTTAEDNSGYGNDGTLYNGSTSCGNPPTAGSGCPEWVDGKYGKALSFDGVDDYVNITDSTSLNPSKISIELWVKPNSLQNLNGVISKGESGNNRWYVEINNTQYNWFVNFDGTWYAVGTSLAITNDVWKHIVFTYNGSVMKAYLNGTDVSQPPSYGSYSSSLPSLPTVSGNLYIGSIGAGNYFNGVIDDVRIYSMALSADEVKENYNTKASNYQVVLEYSKIILTGTAKLGKGEQKVCIEKIGELNSKPLVRITKC